MAKETDIEWCDSTLNLMAGCDGCELWNPAAGVKHCYAGTLTERYGGKNKGFPERFEEPKLFPERLHAALRWPDLTGRDRPDKPWLNGRPRVVFLNDMGDTFTESLPLDWLAPMLPRLADSHHLWLILTKRPKRMAQFSQAHPLPANVWPGASVTSEANVGRIGDLLAVEGGGVKWLSVEPLLGPVDLFRYLSHPEHRRHYAPLHGTDLDRKSGGLCMAHIDWVIVGSESGPRRRPMETAWAESLAQQCRASGVPFFMKQMSVGGKVSGDLGSFPVGLRIREFPAPPAGGDPAGGGG